MLHTSFPTNGNWRVQMDDKEIRRRRSIQEGMRTWLREIKRSLDVKKKDLFRHCGVSDGTIKRYMPRGPFKHTFIPDYATVKAISETTGFAPPLVVAQSVSFAPEQEQSAERPTGDDEETTPVELRQLPDGTCILKFRARLPLEAAIEIMRIYSSVEASEIKVGGVAVNKTNRSSPT